MSITSVKMFGDNHNCGCSAAVEALLALKFLLTVWYCMQVLLVLKLKLSCWLPWSCSSRMWG